MDDKKLQIGKAAQRTFVLYGYRRTSMDDIAREAGVSRPAVYQHFKNKEDVFRASVEQVIEQAFAEGEAATATLADAPPAKWIAAYLTAYLLFYHRLLVTGPHAEELLDTSGKLGKDLKIASGRRLVALLNEKLGEAPEAEIGIVLAHAAEGLKMQAPDELSLISRLHLFIDRFLN